MPYPWRLRVLGSMTLALPFGPMFLPILTQIFCSALALFIRTMAAFCFLLVESVFFLS